ncbi:hypothetical protein VNO77_23215 [Canavalia gladiata]|uniref:Uncharacterized protein n=1 Tax=Canavalia gladiata TaxID=3824 RepID=A0AAN9L418_CANGL
MVVLLSSPVSFRLNIVSAWQAVDHAFASYYGYFEDYHLLVISLLEENRLVPKSQPVNHDSNESICRMRVRQTKAGFTTGSATLCSRWIMTVYQALRSDTHRLGAANSLFLSEVQHRYPVGDSGRNKEERIRSLWWTLCSDLHRFGTQNPHEDTASGVSHVQKLAYLHFLTPRRSNLASIISSAEESMVTTHQVGHATTKVDLDEWWARLGHYESTHTRGSSAISYKSMHVNLHNFFIANVNEIKLVRRPTEEKSLLHVADFNRHRICFPFWIKLMVENVMSKLEAQHSGWLLSTYCSAIKKGGAPYVVATGLVLLILPLGHETGSTRKGENVA